MAGGADPVHDGDWLLMRWARSASLTAVEGRVALVRHAPPGEAPAYYLKRVTRAADGTFELRSDNPAVAPLPADADTVVIALHTGTLRPDQLLTPRQSAFLDALRHELTARNPERHDAYEAAFQVHTEGLRALLMQQELWEGAPDRLEAALAAYLQRDGVVQDAREVARRVVGRM